MILQWHKKKHSVQFSVKQSAQYYKNEGIMMQHLVKQDPSTTNLWIIITIPVRRTIHPYIVSNNPSILQDGLRPNYGESGWFGRTFPDLVRFEGRGVSGLTGPTLCGRVLGPGGSMIRNKE